MKAVVGLLFSCLVVGASPLWAMSAADLKDVKVVAHQFSCRVDTPQGYCGVKNPANARVVLLRVTAQKGTGEDRIWAHDFVLQYAHLDGREDRAAVDVISSVKGQNGDLGIFQSGYEPYVVVTGRDVDIAIGGVIESDVTDIQMCRVGAPPIPYHIGEKREFSVFVTSNSGLDRTTKIADDLRRANYHVAVSDGLVETATGVTVRYAKGLEAEGREVSSRLANLLGTNPRVEQRGDDMCSEFDVIVWLGK